MMHRKSNRENSTLHSVIKSKEKKISISISSRSVEIVAILVLEFSRPMFMGQMTKFFNKVLWWALFIKHNLSFRMVWVGLAWAGCAV